MSTSKCPQRACMTDAETRAVKVSFKDDLDTSELLTGTPTLTEITTSDLTLANKAVNTAALTILGGTVAIGQAVQFTVTGGTAGTTYTIQITAGTDATPAQTLQAVVEIEFIAAGS